MKTLHTIYSTFAKHNMAKFLTVLTLLFTLGVGSVLGAALGDGYEKVTDISTLSAGDRVVLYCDANSVGVTGWDGNKDAEVAASGWVEYLVESATGGVYLKDENASSYIASPGSSNQFKYGTKAVCTVDANGVLKCNNRFLVANGTYYRMYSSVGSYEAFYVYKVLAATPYTVTFHTTATEETECTEASAGAGVTPPTMKEECGDWTFQGWSKSPSNSETSTTKLDLVTLDDGIYYPTADAELYPVYTKSEGGGGTAYTKVATISEGVYVMVSEKTSGTYKYMPNTTSSGANPNLGSGITISTTSGITSLTNEVTDAMLWDFTSTGTANQFYLRPHGSTTIGLGCTTSTGANIRISSTYKDVKWTITTSSSYGWQFKSNASSAMYLAVYSDSNWRNYTSSTTNQNGKFHLFKQTSSSTTYYFSYPQCATEATVTLDLDGGSFDSKPDGWEEDGNNYTKTVNSGDQVTLPEPNKTGHDFEGWYNASTKVTSPYTLTGNTTLTAHWTPQTYDITYKDQGDVAFSGTHENNYPTQHTYGTETTLKGATKIGYTFEGWYTDAVCTNTNKVTTLGATDYTGAITLYAKWTAKALTNYRTFCDVVCDAYSFHTGSDDDREEWLKEAIKCFVEAEGGFEHEWQIKDYIIPNDDDKFFVGNYGYFYNDNLGIGGANGKSRSVVSDWGNMYLAPAMDENDAQGTPRLGHAKGAKGTLRIFEDSNWDNLFVGFIPDGYKLKFGDEEYTFAKTSGSEYRSEVVQYNSTTVENNVSVGVVDADGNYVATNHTQEMRHIFLNTGGTSFWEADNVDNFALYDITNETFTCLMHKTGYPNIYEGWVPTTCAKIIFVRLKSSTIDWNNIHNQTVDITLDATKNLYTINNWNQSDNKSGGTWSVYERYGQFAMHDNSKSKNWYVHFVPHYELTYDKNAGDATGEMDVRTVAVDAANKGVVVADCGFTRPGYRFIKWRKGTTSTYYVPNGSNTIELNADITLYAQWEKEYTVTYDENGGTTSCVDKNAYIQGETVKVCPDVPTLIGYTFDGWIRSDNDAIVKEGASFSMPACNVTLTAKWTINKYKVTWIPNGGNWAGSTENIVHTYDYGATIIKPADPTREGYRFDGWDAEIAATMGTDNLTYTAQWTRVYKITWYENGVPSYTEVPSDNPVVTWEDNIADCGTKKFYGWTADDTFVSDPTTPPSLISKGTTIAGDVTYYAVYADAEEPANPGYTKVTTISEGTYLIATGEASSNKAYTGKYPDKAYGGTCDVTVNNQVIKTKPASAVEVEVTLGTAANSGKFAIYDGTYYLSAPDDNELTFNDNIVYDWKLTAEGHINSTGQSARYIQLNSSASPNRFACYSSNQKKAYLYKKQTTTYENFAVSCATYDISVTTPTGGMVTTTPADEAGAGQEITINVTPDDCKYLTALKYNKYDDSSDYSINISSTPYTFTMPAADVTVTATFADKTATDIEILTSAHRMLMQGSTFVGEQVRITYNNGDKETLNWNDSRLTFIGYNTATLGSQTVTVTYNDCGTQSASYNIEVIDGLGITFWDGDYTETIKYEPGDLVDVDNRIGQNICSGWEFAGWSETQVANESEEYVPVHNFNATDAKVLYAVYVKKKAQWTTIVTADEAKSGAKYVLAYDRYDTYYALTSSVKDVNYLAGKVVTSTEGELNSFDVYYLNAEPTADLIWELISTDENGKWYLYNKNTAKYIDLSTQGQIHLTDLPSDKLQMESGYNDSQIRIASSTVPTYYLSWDNSNTRYNTFASLNSQEYWYTKDEEFTSTPPCSPLSATFHGNGGIVTDGVNSGDDLTITEPTRDAGITTPTASFADCNGKSWTFVGWSRKEIDVTRVPVLTTDLLHDGGGNKHYDIQEDGEEFWAVYTNQGTPETKYGTITFTDADVTRQYENAKTITKSVTAMGDYDFELYHVSNASSKGIQFDHDNATRGYIKNITSLGKINSISFNDFQVGYINYVKVYVGNMPNAINTLLTEADLQQTGNTYTYYPPKNYAYVKIEATDYCGITSISIDFGKGTQIWATTPDCSTITLSGDELYVTSTNGQSIRAAERLTVKAVQLESKAKVVISSNSSDIYFSDVQDANFTQAVKPTETLTLTTDVDGNLSATEIYVHYRPSVDGTGIPEDVVVSANLETPNPSITDDHTIHVRNLPATFAIVAKVGNVWYALPSQGLNSTTPPAAYPVEVDNMADPTAVTNIPDNADWSLRQVYTSSGSNDRFADNGEKLVFVNDANPQKALNAGSTGNYLLTDAQYDGYHNTTNPSLYEWTPTTTDLETYQLTNEQRSRTLSVNTATVFGVHAQDKAVEQVRFLPIQNRYTPAALQVVEWKENSVVIMYNGDPAQTASVSVNGAAAQNTTLSAAQRDIAVYELAANGLAANPTQRLSITIGTEKVILSIPYIISGAQTDYDLLPGSSVSAKREAAKIADLIVLNAATLTAAGVQSDPYKFRHVTIYGGGKLVIPSEKGFGVSSLTMRVGAVESGNYKALYPQLVLNGSINTGNINIDYLTTYDRYYALSLPYQADTRDILYPAEIYGDNLKTGNKASFALQWYNGEARASETRKGWTDLQEPATLEQYKGYTFWGAPRKVSVNGESKRQNFGIHRIPIKPTANDLITGETSLKQIDVKAYPAVNAYDAGWNFLGNPYLAQYGNMEDEHTSGLLGMLSQNPETGVWEHTGNYRYITLTDDGKTYWQTPVSEAELYPFNTFFVQAGENGAVSFNASNRASLPARHYAAQQVTAKEITTGILLTGNDQTDRTGLLIADNFTEEYDYNADLSKFENSGINLYTIGKDGKLAFMAINQTLAEQPIPVGYTAPAEGLYTIAFDEDRYNATDISALYLIDYDSNEKTNLLHTDYSFVTAAGTNNQRFALQVAFAPANATNIEWVGDATVQVGVEGNTLMLNNLPTDAAVHVFDALGRLMYHAPTVPTEMQLTLPTGYYLVRIADKQNAVVIKTVIP